ncbi:MAG: hypothetical protein ACREL7_13820 [Longimicrobiales bacterium]
MTVECIRCVECTDRRSSSGVRVARLTARSVAVLIPRALLVLAALFPGFVSEASAQMRVGHIERIAELRENARPVTLKEATDRFLIRRSPSTQWVPVGPETVLYESDQLRVEQYVDVRLEVERPAQRGRIVFTHEVRDDEGARVIDVLAGPGPANYTLLRDSAATGDLGVVIQSGALVIDWRSGRLVIMAAGHPAVIVSTRVAFAMDADGNSGLLYVEEGTVVFPSSNNFAVTAGQVARLQRGVPPSLLQPGNATVDRYSEATHYNARQVWSRLTPFWRKPAFLLPAIGVVAGTSSFLLTRNGGEERRGGIAIIIRIPF